MYKVLIIEQDKRNRDIIKVGLDNFQQFEVDYAEDAWGVELAREKSYDVIIASLKLAGRTDGMMLVKQIREFDSDVEILMLTHGRSSRLLNKEKALSDIFGLIQLPVDEDAFFKTMARLTDRLKNKRRR